MHREPHSQAEGSSASGPTPIDVFISYRRDDTKYAALKLRDELAEHFGGDHVFMDVVDLQGGDRFVDVLRGRIRTCDVLVALIGPDWYPIMRERARRRELDLAEDYVKVELETALDRSSHVSVIPALLDDAGTPAPQTLPRSIERLFKLEAVKLRHDRWNDDVRLLIDRVESLGRDAAGSPLSRPISDTRPQVTTRLPVDTGDGGASERGAEWPGRKHYAEVAQLIALDNTVVPFLGSAVNGSERTDAWAEGCGLLPDSDELAADLATAFHYPTPSSDLAEIAQYVALTMGKVDLYKHLRRLLAAASSQSDVHRFLASLPKIRQDAGQSPQYQLIVTTNYDNALEAAFDEADEAYDLAVYMSQGEMRGKFFHIPFDYLAEPVQVPNEYVDFPFDGRDQLERTVIMKIHGAVDRLGESGWRENYVITENDYIDYLSAGGPESHIPTQLLGKILESHFLFLGWKARNWNLRVFLHRVFGQRRFGEDAKSWSIDDRVDDVEKRFWDTFGVELFEVPLSRYVDALRDEFVRCLGVPSQHETTRTPL
jgi:hypothetical protein